MLVDFSVTNFLSFKDEVTFSLEADQKENNKTALDSNTFYVDEKKDIQLLKSSAIYGPNASGKTNLLVALAAFRKVVKRSSKMDSTDQYEHIVPFRLAEENIDKPSIFQASIISNGKRYQYGISLTKDKIMSEYLYYYPKKSKNVIFERHDSGAQSYAELHPNETKASKYLSKVQQELIKTTNPNTLFLTKLDQNANEHAKNVTKWFINKLNIFSDNQAASGFTITELKNNPRLKEKIFDFIMDLGTGIKDLKVNRSRSLEDLIATNSPFLEVVSESFLKRLQEKLKDTTFDYELFSIHHRKGVNGQPVEVAFDFARDESKGTNVLFGLLGPIFNVLENKEVLFIDEISNNLHPKLLTKLIKYINSEENNQGAQVVFTTHDTRQLNKELLRRDQIWFTDKKDDESTDLYSLSDIKSKARATDSFEKRYLQGLYGAIPFI